MPESEERSWRPRDAGNCMGRASKRYRTTFGRARPRRLYDHGHDRRCGGAPYAPPVASRSLDAASAPVLGAPLAGRRPPRSRPQAHLPPAGRSARRPTCEARRCSARLRDGCRYDHAPKRRARRRCSCGRVVRCPLCVQCGRGPVLVISEVKACARERSRQLIFSRKLSGKTDVFMRRQR